MASPPDRSRRAFRIVSSRYPHFDGTGTYRWGSRWISPGCWVVHASESYALAVLENLVHWQTGVLPPTLSSVEIEIPRDVAQSVPEAADMTTWPPVDYVECRAIGDAWYERADNAVLWVPSVVSPYESNVLFNQRHPDFARLLIREPKRTGIDERLRRGRR